MYTLFIAYMYNISTQNVIMSCRRRLSSAALEESEQSGSHLVKASESLTEEKDFLFLESKTRHIIHAFCSLKVLLHFNTTGFILHLYVARYYYYIYSSCKKGKNFS